MVAVLTTSMWICASEFVAEEWNAFETAATTASTLLLRGDWIEAKRTLELAMEAHENCVVDEDGSATLEERRRRRGLVRGALNNVGLASYLLEGDSSFAFQQIANAVSLVEDDVSSAVERDCSVYKNLAWLGQIENDGNKMVTWQGKQADLIFNRAMPPTDFHAVSFFDIGLTGAVCRSYQTDTTADEFDGRTAYLDMTKRALTNFLLAELPHQFMPRVEWDLFYRMRDSQNNPPQGRRHGDGITTLALGSLDLVQHAIVEIIDTNVPGDLLEAGVWRGGLAILMAATLRAYGQRGQRILYAADSYAGIPIVDHDQGVNQWTERYDVSRDEVENNFLRYGLLDEGVVFLEGLFNETLREGLPERLSLIHADGDAYDSTMDVLRAAYPRLSVGGYVIIDDFHLPGCRDAVIEYRKERNITEPILPVPHDYVMTCRRGVGTWVDPTVGGDVAQGPRSSYWKRRKPESELVGAGR